MLYEIFGTKYDERNDNVVSTQHIDTFVQRKKLHEKPANCSSQRTILIP